MWRPLSPRRARHGARRPSFTGALGLLALLASGCPQVDGPAVGTGVDAAQDLAPAPPPQTDTEWVEAAEGDCDAPQDWHVVDAVFDGDTLRVLDGHIIRFLMIDTPELSSDDCQAWKASDFTASLVPPGTEVCLVMDPIAGEHDMYNRLLRYVFLRQGERVVQLNTRLLRLGHARMFYPYAKGLRFEKLGVWMQELAAQEQLGGWAACGW